MAEAQAAHFRYPKMLAVILLPFSLWTALLLILPYSASFDLILKVLLWGIPAYLFPKLTGNLHPAEFLFLNQAPRGKWILLSAVFLAAYSVLIHGGSLEIKSVSPFYVVSAVVISPVVEEMAFRGVIYQVFRPVLRFAYANAATTMLFLLYHIPFWIVRGQSISLMGCLWVIFFGACMGSVLSQTRSLWTCILIHAAQNFLFGIL